VGYVLKPFNPGSLINLCPGNFMEYDILTDQTILANLLLL
jgi:hypothetical protein